MVVLLNHRLRNVQKLENQQEIKLSLSRPDELFLRSLADDCRREREIENWKYSFENED